MTEYDEFCLQREEAPEWVAQLPSALQSVGGKEILLVSEEGGRLTVPAILLLSVSKFLAKIVEADPLFILTSPSVYLPVRMECLQLFKEMLFYGEVWGISGEKKNLDELNRLLQIDASITREEKEICVIADIFSMAEDNRQSVQSKDGIWEEKLEIQDCSSFREAEAHTVAARKLPRRSTAAKSRLAQRSSARTAERGVAQIKRVQDAVPIISLEEWLQAQVESSRQTASTRKDVVSEENSGRCTLTVPNKVHSCDQCDKSYTSTSYLKRHISRDHMKVRYACDKCDKSYTSKQSLKFHVNSIHKGINYGCDQCAKVYLRADTLKKHKLFAHC